jgi:hypothetical protein
MPQSIYEAAILLQFPTQGPTNHYRWDEQGTNVNDTGIASLDCTTNGTVVRGTPSGLPGDPDGRSTSQSKDTVMATRGDFGAFDRPATTNKLTLITWFRPDDLRTAQAADAYVLMMKGTNTYGLQVQGSTVRSDINGVGSSSLSADTSNLIVPGDWKMLATVFDGAAQTWKLFLNGVIVGSVALGAGQVVNHALGGTLQLGGYSVIGANGMHGRIQHQTIFNAHAVADAQMQNLFRLGVVPPGVEGNELQYAFPWSRLIVEPGDGFESIDFVNPNPWPAHLSQGGTAVKGGGIMLPPRGGRLPRPSRFDGGWSVILDSKFGYGPIGVEKVLR